MKERVQRLDNQTYWYLIQLLDLEVDEAKKKLPRNTKIFKEVFQAATARVRTTVMYNALWGSVGHISALYDLYCATALRSDYE